MAAFGSTCASQLRCHGPSARIDQIPADRERRAEAADQQYRQGACRSPTRSAESIAEILN